MARSKSSDTDSKANSISDLGFEAHVRDRRDKDPHLLFLAAAKGSASFAWLHNYIHNLTPNELAGRAKTS